MNAEAIGESAEHSHHPHGFWLSDTALVFAMRDIDTLVESVFNAPSQPVGLEPLLSIESLGGKTGDEADGFGFVMAEMTAHKSHLSDKGEINFFAGSLLTVEFASLYLTFVEFNSSSAGGVIA